MNNPLQNCPCLEWTLNPGFSRKSDVFVLSNNKCFFRYNFKYTKNRKIPVLTLDSDTKVPMSFEVKVDVCTGTSTSTRYHSSSIAGGVPPYEIWNGPDILFLNFFRKGILGFRIIFSTGLKLELVEDVNAKTEIEAKKSASDAPPILKKVTCLEWDVRKRPGCIEGPNFVLDGQECFFTYTYFVVDVSERRRNDYLSIISEEEIKRSFDVKIQILSEEGIFDYPTKTVERIPCEIYLSDKSEFPETASTIRIFFSSGVNIEVLESADVGSDAEEKASITQQIKLKALYLQSKLTHKGLSSDFGKRLLDNNFKPDVFIHCGKRIIPAHRNILATRSEVFKAMLQKTMPEYQPETLEIKDMEESVCKQFVEYLYTSSIPDYSVEDVISLHEVAQKYEVCSLEKQCAAYLKENLSAQEALEILVLPTLKLYDDERFK